MYFRVIVPLEYLLKFLPIFTWILDEIKLLHCFPICKHSATNINYVAVVYRNWKDTFIMWIYVLILTDSHQSF